VTEVERRIDLPAAVRTAVDRLSGFFADSAAPLVRVSAFCARARTYASTTLAPPTSRVGAMLSADRPAPGRERFDGRRLDEDVAHREQHREPADRAAPPTQVEVTEPGHERSGEGPRARAASARSIAAYPNLSVDQV